MGDSTNGRRRTFLRPLGLRHMVPEALGVAGSSALANPHLGWAVQDGKEASSGLPNSLAGQLHSRKH